MDNSEHKEVDIIKNNILNTRVAFVGAGNMASAIISGLVTAGLSPDNFLASAPSAATRKSIAQKYKINVTQHNIEAVSFADVIIIAVKPNLVEDVANELNQAIKNASTEKLIVSVAAGVNIEKLQACFDNQVKVISAMPNLPCAVNQGVIGLIAANNCTLAHTQLATALFSFIGQPVWLDNEQQMPALVAAAGSAPAYFFLFLEAMMASAKKLGLSSEQAKNAVLQSGLGALTMALKLDTNVTELRHQVTSPNGTTHQAIQSFMQSNMSSVVDDAMHAAARKAANYTTS